MGQTPQAPGSNPAIGQQNSQGQTVVGRTKSPGEGQAQNNIFDSVIQALVQGQQSQTDKMMQHFGYTSKPTRRLDISGQDMSDPNYKSSLDQFYAKNAGRAGRDAAGAPIQGDAAFLDRIGPLATIDLSARNNALSAPNHNKGFTGGGTVYGTSGNDRTASAPAPLAPMPVVDPAAVANDVWTALGQNPSAFSPKKPATKKPTTAKKSTNIWDTFKYTSPLTA